MTALLRDGQARSGRGLWLPWVLANVVGFAVGGAIAGAIARAMGQPYYGVVTSTAEAIGITTRTAVVATAVFGAAIGTAQWLVVRKELPHVGWWILGTCAGWGLAGVVAGVLGGSMGGAVTGIGRDVGVWGFVAAAAAGILAIAFLPTTFQWMIIQRRVERAWWWLVGAGAAFLAAAALAAGVVRWGMVEVTGWLRPEDFPSAKAWFSFGAVAGVLYGAITGVVLDRLLRVD